MNKKLKHGITEVTLKRLLYYIRAFFCLFVVLHSTSFLCIAPNFVSNTVTFQVLCNNGDHNI